MTSSLCKALFLDRDGTINVDDHYVHKIEDFVFLDGIFDLTRSACERGYKIIVITNQSGIERGYYTEEDFRILTDWMIERFREEGVKITDVFHCPSLTGEDRKPKPGMFLKAAEKWGIDVAASISLGDKERDVEAGKNAGVGINLLLNEEIDSTSENTLTVVTQADAVFHSLADVTKRYFS